MKTLGKITPRPTNHWSEGGITHFHRARLVAIGVSSRLAQFGVGHLAINYGKRLADKLEPILKSKTKQRRLFSCRKTLNALCVVSLAAGAFCLFAGFHKCLSRDNLFPAC